jgi:hypothetical protein
LVKDNKIEDEATKKTIEQQLNELIDF